MQNSDMQLQTENKKFDKSNFTMFSTSINEIEAKRERER